MDRFIFSVITLLYTNFVNANICVERAKIFLQSSNSPEKAITEFFETKNRELIVDRISLSSEDERRKLVTKFFPKFSKAQVDAVIEAHNVGGRVRNLTMTEKKKRVGIFRANEIRREDYQILMDYGFAGGDVKNFRSPDADAAVLAKTLLTDIISLDSSRILGMRALKQSFDSDLDELQPFANIEIEGIGIIEFRLNVRSKTFALAILQEGPNFDKLNKVQEAVHGPLNQDQRLKRLVTKWGSGFTQEGDLVSSITLKNANITDFKSIVYGILDSMVELGFVSTRNVRIAPINTDNYLPKEVRTGFKWRYSNGDIVTSHPVSESQITQSLPNIKGQKVMISTETHGSPYSSSPPVFLNFGEEGVRQGDPLNLGVDQKKAWYEIPWFQEKLEVDQEGIFLERFFAKSSESFGFIQYRVQYKVEKIAELQIDGDLTFENCYVIKLKYTTLDKDFSQLNGEGLAIVAPGYGLIVKKLNLGGTEIFYHLLEAGPI